MTSRGYIIEIILETTCSCCGKNYAFRNYQQNREIALSAFNKIKLSVDPHGAIREVRIYDVDNLDKPLETFDGIGMQMQ